MRVDEVSPQPIVHVCCSMSSRHTWMQETCYSFLKEPRGGPVSSAPAPEPTMIFEEDQWSSEGEEDRMHPVSLRARLKGVFAFSSKHDIITSMLCMSLHERPADVSVCTTALKALSIEEGHRCAKCQHRFALKKTRDLHMKACRG